MVEQSPTELDHHLSSWRVLPEGPVKLRALHARALNQAAARRALELAQAKPGGTSVSRQLTDVLDRIRYSTWTKPELAFAHYCALRRTNASDDELRQVALWLAEVCRSDAPPPALEGLDEETEWVRHGFDQIAAYYRELGTARPEPGLAPRTSGDVQACRDALDILRTRLPELAAMVDALVRQVVWFKAVDGHRAGVTVGTYGALYLAPGGGLGDTLERMVHETSHLEIIARRAVDKALLNGSQRTIPEPNARPRPLGRILHHTIIAFRTVELLDSCLVNIPPEERETVIARRQRAVELMEPGVSVLTEFGKWTELGEALLDSLATDHPRSAPDLAPSGNRVDLTDTAAH